MSEKLLEKLKISVKQEGNTRQPAVPSEQKARQPGCEVLCWDSRTLRERCQLLNGLGTKIKGGEVGGKDNKKPGMAALSQLLMAYEAHRMRIPPAITKKAKAVTTWRTVPRGKEDQDTFACVGLTTILVYLQPSEYLGEGGKEGALDYGSDLFHLSLSGNLNGPTVKI